MTCPTPQQLAAHLDGEATRNESELTGAHVAGCAACRAQLSRMQRAIEGLPAALSGSEDAAFTRDVVARLTPTPRRVRWPVAAAALAVGLAALVLAPRLHVDASDGFAPRGGARAPSASQVSFAAFVHPHSAPATRHPVAAAETIHLDDGFSFEVHNRTGKAVFAALFAVDAAGEIHWFYPAWPEGAEDPESLRVPPTPALLALPEGVTPAGLSPGPLQLVGVFADAPSRAARFESLVREGGVANLRRLSPATVQIIAVTAVEEKP